MIADLYCGVGLFAVTADQPKRIVAVERGRSAVADAKHNLKGRDARVVRADVGKWHGNKVDVVIADPSRAGLGKDGARTVLACDPERVVLVSCDAAALARDVALLTSADYNAHVGDARRPVRAHAARRVRDGARPVTLRRANYASCCSSLVSASSSETFNAKLSSDTRMPRARTSIAFSPAERPLVTSRSARFRTTSATW